MWSRRVEAYPRDGGLPMTPRVNPDAAREVMRSAGLEPLAPYPGAAAQWRCRCATCGREVTPRYMNIRKGWGGCRKCAAATRGHRQLGSEVDAVAEMSAAGLEPLAPYPGCNKPWQCTCLRCGKEVSPRLSAIRNGQSGCKWCARRAVEPSDAASVMVAAGLEPLEEYPGALAKWRCRCRGCGEEVTPCYNNVRNGHSGCLRCSQKHNGDSQRLDPKAAAAFMVSRGYEPLEPYVNSSRPWLCMCLKCSTVAAPTYGNIKSGWGGCPTCRGAAQSAKQRRPEEVAVSAMHSAGLKPLEPFRSSAKPWLCECMTCGKQVNPRLDGILAGQGGCKWCAKCAVDPVEAAEHMRAAGLEPLVPYPGRHAGWLSRCATCDGEVSPAYGSIRSGQGGCRRCNPGGFKIAEPAIVYLTIHPEFGAAKIGVGHADGGRITQHLRQGWQTVGTFPMSGDAALEVERAVLSWWRSGLGLPPFLSRLEMPQSGWTETVDLDAVDIPATIRLIKKLVSPVGDTA